MNASAADDWARSFEALARPLRLAGIRLANRLMMSALTLQYGIDGLMSDRHFAFYLERARGEVGLLCSEQLVASPLSESPFTHSLRAYDSRQVERFRCLETLLRPYATRFFVQLFSAGAAGTSIGGLSDWKPLRGPSPRPAPGGDTPVPLTVSEIQQLAEDYARSARNVYESGLHGVEIHGAHGWLVGQFLSPLYNCREDRYGGSVENRCRFAIEIGAAIRREVGRDFPVGISLTYDELMGDSGITCEDTLEQLRVLGQSGLFDFFDLSLGSTHQQHFTIASMAVPKGLTLEFAGRAKQLIGDRAAIFTGGRITDVQMAGRAIADGQADVISMARALMADPDLLVKARSGRHKATIRCVGANFCVARALADQPVGCVVNPATGREAEWKSAAKPTRVHRIAVIGGGPAGLTFGARAASAGHQVSVLERKAWAGGHLSVLGSLPGRNGWNEAVQDMIEALREAGGDLQLDVNVTAESPMLQAPDYVVVATGGRWSMPDVVKDAGTSALEGFPRIIGLDEAIESSASGKGGGFGVHTVILDDTGTLPPLVLADLLASWGIQVTFASAKESIGAVASLELELQHVMPRLQKNGVSFLVGYSLIGLGAHSAKLRPHGGGPVREIPDVDCVVSAVSRDPVDHLSRALSKRRRNVLCIGDALSPRTTASVIHEAALLARSWPEVAARPPYMMQD